MRKYKWKKRLLATMLATGIVVTGIPDTGIGLSKVIAATVSKQSDIITEDGFHYTSDGYLYEYIGTATDIVIPEGVTRISSSAFDKVDITSVVIPGTVKVIGSYCFYKCNKLKKVVMKEGVTEIKRCAFEECTALAEVILPDSVTTIEMEAFRKTPSVTEISLPKSLKILGSRAFAESGLTAITIPGSVENVEFGAFQNCASLKKVVIEDGVKSMGVATFRGDETLTEVSLPKTLTNIGSRAFAESGLIEVTVPGSVENIEHGAFENCTSLQSAVLEDGVKSVGEDAFYGDTALTSIIFPSTGLEEIKSFAFVKCKIEKLDIQSCEVIEDYAFSGPKSLKKLHIGSGVKRIGNHAFGSCDELEELTIDPGLEMIGDNAFYGAEKLTSLEFPNTLTYIGYEAFWGSKQLSEVLLPTGLKYMGRDAFYNSIWMNNLYDKAKNEGEFYVKEGTILLTTVSQDKRAKDTGELTIPNGESGKITVISKINSNTSKLNIGDGVISIGSYALLSVGEMEELVVADSVKIIGKGACSSCDKLKKVILPSYIQEIPASMFSRCKNLTDVNIPKEVSKIGYFAFKGCSSLTSVSFPEGLTTIDMSAFAEMPALKELTIPAGVNFIGYNAFGTNKSGGTDTNSLTLKGYEGSLAQTYAEENDIPFVSLGAMPDKFDEEKKTQAPAATEEIIATPKATDEPVKTSDATVISQATQNPDGIAQTEAPSYKVTLETNGGSCEISAIIVKNGTPYGILPAVSKVNCAFQGWFTQPEGGTKIENTTVANLESDQILYAQFIEDSLKISFKGNGGSIEGDQNEKVVYAQSTYGELPTATRSGYSFIGWYTQESGGQIITEDMIVNSTGEMSVYAHWVSTKQDVSFDSLHYNFLNSGAAFGYPQTYHIPLSVFQYLYGKNTKAKTMYQEWPDWGGNCFGMVSTALMLNLDGDDMTLADFGENYTRNSDLTSSVMNKRARINLTRFIETLQIAQRESEISQDKSNHIDDWDALEEAVKATQEGKGMPIILSIHSKTSGHAVAAYKIDDTKIYIYDPNYDKEEKYVSITRDSDGTINGWSYKINGTEECGNTVENSWISYYSYESVLRTWEKRSSECYSSEILVGCNVDSYKILSESGETLAQMKNGQLSTNRSDIYLCDSDEDTVKDGMCKVYLPEGSYKIQNTSGTSELRISVIGTERSITTTTQAKEVFIDLKDFTAENECSITPANGQNYSVTLESTALIDKESIQVQGVGNGNSIGVEQNQGAAAFVNCDNAAVKVENKAVSLVPVNASAEAGGTISRQGQKSVIKGEDATYAIIPDWGYMVSDVIIDGKSKGNITSYTFKNISGSHTISAKFEKASFENIDVTTMTDVQSGIIPTVQVKLGKQILTEKDDFKVSKVSEDEKTMKLLISGLGTYKGTSKTVEFKIGDKAGTQEEEKKEKEKKKVTVGSVHQVGNYKYKVSSTSAKTVTLTKKVKGKKAVTIPATVKINGTSYKVTAIGANIWKNDKTLQSVVIGTNVKKIGAKAFFGAKNLKKVTIKTKNLTSVGSGAFKGVSKKFTIKVPAGKKKAYQKLMKKKGLPSKAKWK